MSKLSKFTMAVMICASVARVTHAETINVSNWIPSTNGTGDIWTFVCPVGGTFSLKVDTQPDRSGAPLPANIDPAFYVQDADSNFVFNGDDDTPCTHAEACGFSCPSTGGFVACGADKKHVLTILNNGGTNNTGCSGGGGYVMTLIVKDADGVELDAKHVKLGGTKVKVPTLTNPYSPAINDGDVF